MTKLKTEMQDGCVHAMGVCIDPEDVHYRQVMHIEHDAAYAHALVQAMDEVVPNTMAILIELRAYEIMRGFGYGDEK